MKTTSDLHLPARLKMLQLWLHGKSPGSRRIYLTDINQFLSFTQKQLEDISMEDVQNWDSFCESRYAPATRARKLAAVKSLFTFALENQLLATNPGRGVKIPKVKEAIAERILSEEEWQRLLYAEPKRQHQLMLQLLYETRARVGEFCRLRWKDFREKADGSASVTLFGKGNKTRQVTINPHLWSALKQRRGSDTKGDEPLFINRFRKAYSTVQVWRIVKAAGERVGIYGVSPHWIRHTGATHQLLNGSPVHLQQKELGHSRLEVTSRYLHLLPGEYGAQYIKVKPPF